MTLAEAKALVAFFTFEIGCSSGKDYEKDIVSATIIICFILHHSMLGIA